VAKVPRVEAKLATCKFATCKRLKLRGLLWVARRVFAPLVGL